MIPAISQVGLQTLLDRHREWLLIHSNGQTFPVLNDEFDLEEKPDKLLLGFPDDRGFQYWRVVKFVEIEGGILLDLTTNFSKRRERIRFVSRAAARELGEAVELARLEKANGLARRIAENFPRTKMGRVALNKENGRLAQIIVVPPGRAKMAYLADVSDTLTAESMLAAAILWLLKLEKRKKDPIDDVSVLAEKKLARNLQKLHAMLAPPWKFKIRIVEISRKEEPVKLLLLPDRRISELWREKAKKLAIPETQRTSGIANRILGLSPGKIDVIFSKNGETLRFLGLPFARVRTIGAHERAWFGTGRDKQILVDMTWEHLLRLVEDLETYRRQDTPNKRHELYTLAPEAWLEALLRQNIKLLDANLILSPIYNQFRASMDKIDLLALRKDGRLVIIELKTSIDREMVFQAADYWRKIELQRRAGHLQAARLFGTREILDKPTLVYLAAPALSYHPEFGLFARAISPEIEMYRFDLHENWRNKVKVLGQLPAGRPPVSSINY